MEMISFGRTDWQKVCGKLLGRTVTLSLASLPFPALQAASAVLGAMKTPGQAT